MGKWVNDKELGKVVFILKIEDMGMLFFNGEEEYAEIPQEWYPLVQDTLNKIYKCVKQLGLNPNHMVFAQIKEKYDTLRIYWYYDSECDYGEKNYETLVNEVDNIILKAEQKVLTKSF